MTDTQTLTPALARVTKGGLCSGCGACRAIAPTAIIMELAGDGFLRPRQTSVVTSDQDAAISKACPGLGQCVSNLGRKDHPLWGPFLEMHTGFATDPELRFKASSGGALSGMLAWLIESGEVKSALTNTADPDRAVANVPILAKNRSDIARAAGSRYAPSAPLAALDMVEDGPSAFVGKPCDVVALRVMQTTDPVLAAQFPVVLSFFCAGVPSLAGGESILEALGVTPKTTAVFRYRGHGWPGRATAVAKDGSETSMTYEESWGSRLSPRVQHRCKLCADGTGVAADLVFADAWETDTTGYPLFEEADGISLIVARTRKGADLLARAIAAGALEAQDFDVTKLAAMQPGQTRRRQALAARLAGQRLLGRTIPKYRGLSLRKAAQTGSLKWALRNLIGMIRRGRSAGKD
ncbi:Coenzyme F420 hydrogenase/dehydrogenase, beta subunit C-terminal domain [Boseongicola aestuarii]|uniref:Coenzyme F420-reducing hydrogenase subunit beta n=1 Tax=Boseongicola aestuarii TaxID=1470561 RepID=A0A238J211_9RHOB|nr:Coenzyme F420 hydrogenase/dehydrogenase, beta subunit C-terminal domain [Boseongicola aestuarii]SMX24252.1 coenzyme F420-reducing hydrogenase subunit beta [Boseongicola aestuarii]